MSCVYLVKGILFKIAPPKKRLMIDIHFVDEKHKITRNSTPTVFHSTTYNTTTTNNNNWFMVLTW